MMNDNDDKFEFPKRHSNSVKRFSELHRLRPAVSLIFTEVDPKYKTDYCHVSAKDAAKNGGERVHGWALWDFGSKLIIGNFHSVWKNGNNEFVEVTPPKKGSKILFVPDDRLSIEQNSNGHLLYNDRTDMPDFKIVDLDGNPTTDSRFLWPVKDDLKDYCASLGWSEPSMVP